MTLTRHLLARPAERAPDCPGSGELRTFANSAITAHHDSTGRPSYARVRCTGCPREFTGRAVRSSAGVTLRRAHVMVPRHRAASEEA